MSSDVHFQQTYLPWSSSWLLSLPILVPGKPKMSLSVLCQLSQRAAAFWMLPGCFSVRAQLLSRCVLPRCTFSDDKCHQSSVPKELEGKGRKGQWFQSKVLTAPVTLAFCICHVPCSLSPLRIMYYSLKGTWVAGIG